MDRPGERPTPAPVQSAKDLFAFRPWMLAAAVILACALGVAVMEDLRAPEMWAQATTSTSPGR